MIASQLNRQLSATYQKANELGFTFPCKINFTRLEEDFIRNYYLQMTNEQLASELGKKKTIVRMKLYELGLRRYNQKARAWTDEEDKILIANYRTMGDVAMSKIITGRTKKGICKRRRTLKLQRTPEESAILIEQGKQKFLQNSFKPGHTVIVPSESRKQVWVTRRKNMKKQEVIKSRPFVLNP